MTRAFKPQTVSHPRRQIMAREDVAAGKIKQIKGKADDIAAEVTGNTVRQIKGKKP